MRVIGAMSALLRRKGTDYIDQTTSSYWPAYLLSDWSLERAGRIAPPDKQLSDSTELRIEVS